MNRSQRGAGAGVGRQRVGITYLGTREVAAVTFEMGLRAVFPQAAELAPIWERAARRGVLMGRIAAALGVDPWIAHSAGLFEECGKAVLFRHSSSRYKPLLASARDDGELVGLEHAEFGVSHDKLGGALCESWGLAAPAVASVRHHVEVQATRELPAQLQRRAVCALSAIAHALMTAPDTVEDVAQSVAPQAQLDETLVLRGARKVEEQLAAAAARS